MLYSYSKSKVLITFILDNTYDVVDFGSPWLNIYENNITLKSRRTQNEPLFGADFEKFFSKMSKERPLQSMAIVIGPCWVNFCSQKLKRRILATFGFNRTTLHATQLDVLRPVFEDCIISSRADVLWPSRSCNLSPLDYCLWGGVKDKCYADKSETIDSLKDNIRETIGEIQLHTIDNVLKNWTDRIGYCMPCRGSHLNEIIFHY